MAPKARCVAIQWSTILHTFFFPSLLVYISPAARLSKVGRVREVLEPDKVLLDAARGHEAVEDRDAARLVVCAAAPRATERLLADDRARALLVVVHVAGGVTQAVRRVYEGLAVRRETGYGVALDERRKQRIMRTYMEPVSA